MDLHNYKYEANTINYIIELYCSDILFFMTNYVSDSDMTLVSNATATTASQDFAGVVHQTTVTSSVLTDCSPKKSSSISLCIRPSEPKPFS